jgi:hypothetical protein
MQSVSWWTPFFEIGGLRVESILAVLLGFGDRALYYQCPVCWENPPKNSRNLKIAGPSERFGSISEVEWRPYFDVQSALPA